MQKDAAHRSHAPGQGRPPFFLRTRLILYPKFQLILAALNVAVFQGVLGVAWWQGSLILSDLAPVAGLSGIEAETYRSYVASQTSSFHACMAFAVVVGSLAIGGITLMLSHRFVGPLVNLTNYLKSVSAEPKPAAPLRFRKGDMLGELPPLVNAAIERSELRGAERGRRGAA